MTVITIRKNRLLIGDLVIALGSVWLSYLIRLESTSLIQQFSSHVLFMSVSALILKPVFFRLFGIYRIYWEYWGLREFSKLIFSSTLGSITIVLITLLAIRVGLPATFPRSVIGLDWIISTSLFLLLRRFVY
jgi:FlaA1/EpsC-like NDP-sugar epimerase